MVFSSTQLLHTRICADLEVEWSKMAHQYLSEDYEMEHI